GDDVLWLTGERYSSRTPLHEHAKALAGLRGINWFAAPSGATGIARLRAPGPAVRPAHNDTPPATPPATPPGPTARVRGGRGRRPAHPRGHAVPLPHGRRAPPRGREPGGRAQPRPGRPSLPGLRAGRGVSGAAAASPRPSGPAAARG